MADVDAARRALEDAIGAGEVLSDPLALRLYARDASMVEGGCALVAFPRTRDDIVTCVRVASEHGLPIVPRGSGTGLVGGSTPIGDALVVVTTKMTGILEIRSQDRLAWVEPGVPNLDLANALRPHGFTFAPDPSSQQTSSIGGNVSTNAGGPHCLAYGVTSNHVLALDVVLADGSVARLGSEAPETAGYDLRAVMIGSEGTLGIVAAACANPSAATTMPRSIISTAAGTTPLAMIPLTVAAQSSTVAKSNSIVRTAGGRGVSRTHAAATIPSVPSLPIITARRS